MSQLLMISLVRGCALVGLSSNRILIELGLVFFLNDMSSKKRLVINKCMRSKVPTSSLCVDVKCTFVGGWGGGSKARRSEEVLKNGCFINGSKSTLGVSSMYFFFASSA